MTCHRLDTREITESRAFMAGWAFGCGAALLLVLAYTLIAYGVH